MRYIPSEGGIPRYERKYIQRKTEIFKYRERQSDMTRKRNMLRERERHKQI